MAVSTGARWCSIKTVHEQYGAPFDLLGRIAGLQTGTVANRAAREGWSTVDDMLHLLPGLVTAVQGRIRAIESADADLDAEKAARSLASLAKTLETITAITDRRRRTAVEGTGSTARKDAHVDTDDRHAIEEGPERVATLDRKLKAFISTL